MPLRSPAIRQRQDAPGQRAPAYVGKLAAPDAGDLAPCMCGALVDRRDPAELFRHLGPLPHPVET